jgi:hypothetical protein
MAFRIQVHTALLPVGFAASDNILSELGCVPEHQIPEYSVSALSHFIKIPCISTDGRITPWMLANPAPNWSITFQSNKIIYGTAYWVNYKPDGLLEYLRERSDNYELIYQRDGVDMFTLQVIQFSESGQWQVRITPVWPTETDLILQDMSSIFNPHAQCTVCLDDAFQVRWPVCTHTFCTDCIRQWRTINHNHTCPLCRARTTDS